MAPAISEELRDQNISPDEGFLLSRVNGEMDLKTILIISPMDPLEAQVAFLRLKEAGLIEIE